MFVDLTVAYDIGVSSAYLQTFAIAFGRTHSFLHHETASESHLYSFNWKCIASLVTTSEKGFHQGLVLSLSCFPSVINLPDTIAKKSVYADHLATMYSLTNWLVLDEVLTKDMATLSSYLQK